MAAWDRTVRRGGQLRRIVDALQNVGEFSGTTSLEVPHPGTDQQCDIILESGGTSIPVEAKLIRFRRDNGNIDPNMYTSVFSPFPEEGSSSLLTDARKLYNSAFGQPYGLLGIYYEQAGEYYDRLTADRIAEKLATDIRFWYEIRVETVARAGFDGLRHPHHQRGEIIAWLAM